MATFDEQDLRKGEGARDVATPGVRVFYGGEVGCYLSCTAPLIPRFDRLICLLWPFDAVGLLVVLKFRRESQKKCSS